MPRLPHERDQSPEAVSPERDPKVEQAARDLARGLVDTDLRATPGVDAQQRERLVPGPAGKSRPAKPGGR